MCIFMRKKRQETGRLDFQQSSKLTPKDRKSGWSFHKNLIVFLR